MRDHEELVQRINELLANYSDLAFVKEHARDLRDIKERLGEPVQTTPEAELEKVFGPSELYLPELNRAEMVFDFGAEEVGSWKPGDWKLDGHGWRASESYAREELGNELIWPRLLLSKPVKLDHPFSVEFNVEFSGPPREFLVSVAGWHVLLDGPDSVGGKSRFLFNSGGAEGLKELLDEAENPSEGKLIEGLQRGHRYTLRIELTHVRGKIRVLLDGKALDTPKDRMRPSRDAGSHSVVVRSTETVVLHKVTIETEFRL